MLILHAAERWGCPPWEVRGQVGAPVTRLRWLVRHNFYHELLAKKREIDAEEQGVSSGGKGRNRR